MKGLSYIPNFTDDDQEYVPELFADIASRVTPNQYFSIKNRGVLLTSMTILDLDIGYGVILEIGIGKKQRYAHTSTKVILDHKYSDVWYLGIDAENRDWLNDKGTNVVIYNDLSGNVYEELDKKKFIDLLHIDGSHSVNGILVDWQFTDLVKDSGIILMHDIKVHPGPMLLIDAIDRDIYTVHKLFMDEPDDFGMGVIYKKENIEYDTIRS